MDLHAGQIQGFFNIPFDHLYAHAGAHRRAAPHVAVGTSRSWSRPTPAASSAPAPISKRLRRRPGHHRQAALGAQRLRGHEHHRRREGQDRDHRRRHHRHRRHAVQRGPRGHGRAAPSRSWRAPATPVFSGKAIERIEASPLTAGHRHQHHPAQRGRAGLRQDQGALGRPPARRGGQAHPSRRFDQLAVRLSQAREETKEKGKGHGSRQAHRSRSPRHRQGREPPAARRGQGARHLLRRQARQAARDHAQRQGAQGLARPGQGAQHGHRRAGGGWQRRRGRRAHGDAVGLPDRQAAPQRDPRGPHLRSIRTRRSRSRCRWSWSARRSAPSTAARSTSSATPWPSAAVRPTSRPSSRSTSRRSRSATRCTSRT